MNCTFYLDRPYNPDIDRESLKKELAAIKTANKKLSLKLLNPKPTSVYLFFSPDKNTRLKHRTSIKIQPKYWDFKNGIVKSIAPGGLELNAELNDLATQIMKNAYKEKEKQEVVSKNVYKRIMVEVIDKDNLSVDEENLEELIRKFKHYKAIFNSHETMKEYNTVFKALEGYQARHRQQLTLLDFDRDFYLNFEKFLSTKENPNFKGRGLLNDTIYKYIATLKVFLTWCREGGYAVHPDTFKKHQSAYKRLTYNEIVVLTESELAQLHAHDLSFKPHLERVRDVFCFACYTGQRYSDVMRFNKADFKDNKWSFRSSKTKKKIIVPFNGYIARALEILEKYNYRLPEITNQKFNIYIKEVGKIVGIDEPVRITRFNGKREIVIQHPKYGFMTSHMGRRTMVTILLSKGVPITLVRKITQHSDIRTLMKYEQAGMDSLVEALDRV